MRNNEIQSKLRIARCVATVLLFGCKSSHPEVASEPSPSRVLFIGNSYTSFNNQPQIFREIAASAGHAPLEIESATPDGMTLQRHLHLPATLKLIDEGNWDVVILQAQSEEAAKSEQVPEVRSNFLAGAAGLYDRIKQNSPRAKVVYYETWARHADYWKDASADRRVGSSPADMQARICKWDEFAIGQRKDFIIAPVGDAWQLNYQNSNAVRLHREDNSHPAFNGSYLAALVLYGTIYHPPNLNVSYFGDLGSSEAKYLQGVATAAMQHTIVGAKK